MFKYVTLNGDVYIKTDALTMRRAVELLVTKCRHLYVSAYNLFNLLRSI
ncbi:MAG: hypothetical protein ACRCZI_02980 [Cetobacterium sp.]